MSRRDQRGRTSRDRSSEATSEESYAAPRSVIAHPDLGPEFLQESVVVLVGRPLEPCPAFHRYFEIVAELLAEHRGIIGAGEERLCGKGSAPDRISDTEAAHGVLDAARFARPEDARLGSDRIGIRVEVALPVDSAHPCRGPQNLSHT